MLSCFCDGNNCYVYYKKTSFSVWKNLIIDKIQFKQTLAYASDFLFVTSTWYTITWCEVTLPTSETWPYTSSLKDFCMKFQNWLKIQFRCLLAHLIEINAHPIIKQFFIKQFGVQSYLICWFTLPTLVKLYLASPLAFHKSEESNV